LTERLNEGADGQHAQESGEARVARVNRIASKLERLAAQRKALRVAIGQFGDGFDAKAWADAFDSPDHKDINGVLTVTGGYLALVNNTAEAIRTGAKLTDLKPTPGTPGLPGVIDAIRADGGFTSGQAETFTDLYRTRNRLQHASPDIEADEVRRQALLLLRHLPSLVKNYLAWLERRRVEL
jgi:hypothetical protein